MWKQSTASYCNTHHLDILPQIVLKQNNTKQEMFIVDKVFYTNPITNKIKDLKNEEIKGSFCEPELLKATQEAFRIYKVIQRDHKKIQALVKWNGYDDDFNSWISIKDLINSGARSVAKRSPIIIRNSSNASSRKNLDVRPYDRPYKVLLLTCLGNCTTGTIVMEGRGRG